MITFLRYRGFRPHVADEAASYAVSEAWRKNIDGPHRMAWLFKVAIRKASKESKSDTVGRLTARGYMYPAQQPDGTEKFAAAEVAIDFRTAMRKLDEREQKVMVLHLEDRSTSQIAAALRLSPRTVNRLVASARDKLRVLLDTEERRGARSER